MRASEFREVYGILADYWGEADKGYPVEDWQMDVQDGTTRLGYWDWVCDNQEMDFIRTDTGE